jgi:hypothetical protein
MGNRYGKLHQRELRLIRSAVAEHGFGEGAAKIEKPIRGYRAVKHFDNANHSHNLQADKKILMT